MNYRIFGQHTGLYVSELILGGAMLGTAMGYGAEKEESIKILKAYADAGGNFIDTSDAYQFGESETIIGEFIAPNRNDYVISSKFSRTSNPNPPTGALGNNRKIMVQSVEQSLKRLKTDRIDIYIAHFDDGITAIEEIVRGIEDLVSTGKIIYGGLSNFAAWKVASAVKAAGILNKLSVIALQTEFSLMQRVPEKELLPMANYFGLGVMGYSPLAGGLLTGKYRDNKTGRINVMKNEAQLTDPRNEAILNKLIEIAVETGESPANIAVAWVSAQDIFPIIGPRTKVQIDDYLTSVNLKLKDADITALNQVSEVPSEYPHNINKIQQELVMKVQV